VSKPTPASTEQPEDGDVVELSQSEDSEDASDSSATTSQAESKKATQSPATAVAILAANLPIAKAAGAKASSANSEEDSSDDSTSSESDAAKSSADLATNAAIQQVSADPNNTQQKPSNSPENSASDDTEEQTAPVPTRAKVAALDSSAQAAGAAEADSSSESDSTSAQPADSQTSDAAKPADFDSALQTAVQVLPEITTPAGHSTVHAAQVAIAPTATPQTPVAQFAETNQPTIVSTIHGSLLPNGGTMNIALNPPDLGAMQITVKMQDGTMSASFQTSSDQATRLLTHSLGQLKTALEGQGVTVQRLHVHQVSSSESSSGKGGDSESKDQPSSDGRGAQQEQQRRENLRRMWRRARGGRDPLDLVA